MTFCVRIRLLMSAKCCLVYPRSQNSQGKRGANVCRKLISIIIHVNKKAHVYAHIHRDKGVQFQLVWDIFILCNKS